MAVDLIGHCGSRERQGGSYEGDSSKYTLGVVHAQPTILNPGGLHPDSPESVSFVVDDDRLVVVAAVVVVVFELVGQ
ncbi:hypothetical protein [Streptomyces sp. WM6372]|uniref:hypothetical protein n=1 Tax=Streptomyces sp. WM6372 TaxID=1415555 RepID=UPI000AECB92B|nr:hypothetical protein [Streptomyces sp. WM6372]